MSQIKVSGNLPQVSVTNGSPTITFVGVDLTTELAAAEGWAFHVGTYDSSTGITTYEATTYYIGSSPPVYSAGDTTIDLTGNYTGTSKSGTQYKGVVDTDYSSPNDIIKMSAGDVDTPSIIRRMVDKIQDIFTGIINGTLTTNHSRRVVTTAVATANYYADLCTISLGSADNADIVIPLLLTCGEGTSLCNIRLNVIAKQTTTISSTESKIQVESISDTTNIDYNDFFLAAAAITKGTALHLWMQSKTAVKWQVTELSRQVNSNASTQISYNDSAPWTETDPLTGPPAVAITSDWAGSGQLSSTSLLNGWAGTIYYEKSADGWVKVYGDISTIGTTTDGTQFFAIPSGFLHTLTSNMVFELYGTDNTYASSAGRISVSNAGAIYIYGYTGTNTAVRFEFSYRARG